MRETFIDDLRLSEALPEKIYIEPASVCNLHCSICFRNGWIDEKQGFIERPLFQKLCGELARMTSVREVFFGGMGEPLCHPEICEMVSEVPENIKRSLLTNATLLTRQMSEGLARAGLDQLWISMDGFDRGCYEAIQQGSLFRRILDNLACFNEVRENTKMKLGITFVITPENLAQLDRIDDFADRFRADELNISHMIPWQAVKEEDWLYDRVNVPLGKMRRLSEGSAVTEPERCPFINGSAVFVRWDGEVIPCMQLLHSCCTYLYEEKRKIRSFSYGNIGSRRLIDCWNDEDYRDFRTRVDQFYFPFCLECGGCEDRKENLTDCFVSRSPACGACLWSTGKVFCP